METPTEDDKSLQTNLENKVDCDAAQLLSIFPEEIWIEVLERIVDSSDLENTCNSSPFFRNLLFDKRVLFLFSKVWPIYSDKYLHSDDDVYNETKPGKDDGWITDDESDSDNSSSEYEVVSDTSSDGSDNQEVVWFHGLLKLRLVCKTWCDVFDNFYQHHPEYFEMNNDEHPLEDTSELDDLGKDGKDVGNWMQLETFCEDNHPYLSAFMKHFENTHGNKDLLSGRPPMFTREVGIEYCEAEIDFVDILVIPFLEKYGHHIWYLRITADDDFDSRGDYYLKMRQILELVPNLITLNIEYSRKLFGVLFDIPSSREELCQLKGVIDQNPLTKMADLQFLKTDNLLCPIFNEIIRANSHLSMLEIFRKKGVHDDYDIYTQPLPDLKQLSMMYFSKADFQKLEQGNWSLEKLYLSFAGCPFFKWSRIFSLLENKWEITLKNVVLYLPKADKKSDEGKILQESATLRLNLPRVERLKLFLSNASSLDFILPLRESLISLNIKTYYDAKKILPFSVKQQQIVQFLGYFGDQREEDKQPYQSNIWTIFEKLERFKVWGEYAVKVGRNKTGSKVREHCWKGTRREWKEKMGNIKGNLSKLKM